MNADEGRISGNTLILTAIIIVLSMAVALLWFRPPEEVIKTEKETITRTDTVRDTVRYQKAFFIPVRKEVIRHDTILDTITNEPIAIPIESSTYRDTMDMNGDTLNTEITISGYNARLDSFRAELRRQRLNTYTETIVTNTVRQGKTLRDRIKIGPSATTGYDPIRKEWGMTVGLGITIDLY